MKANHDGKRAWGWALIAAAVIGLYGCTMGGLKPTTTLDAVMAQTDPESAAIKDLNAKLFASAGGVPEFQDYILNEGDLIQVSVFEAPELNTEVRIGARGFVTLPLLGSVEVKGLTTVNAEQLIEDLYREKYLQDPHVSIFVKERFGGKITVLGSVEESGSFDYPARQRLLDALALAGGLSETAGRTVQIRRKGENPERPDTYLVDLDQLIEEGHSELNLEILPGDVIFVPEARMVYVDGAVREPGAYPIRREMTVQQAIVEAGGLRTTASEGNIKLVRYMPGGSREVVQLSLNDIQNGKAQEMTVRDRDVVFVETSTFEAMIYGLRLNLGMGLMGIGYSPPPQ
jgi:polysaccharide export outer membrane protein